MTIASEGEVNSEALRRSRRALFVANRTFGIVSSRIPLVKRLIENDWEVSVAGRLDDSRIILEDLGCQLVHIPFASGGFNPWKDLIAFVRLRNLIKSLRPGLIHNFNAKPTMLGTFLARRIGAQETSIVNTITGLGYAYQRSGVIQKVSNVIYSRLLDSADHTVFQNEHDRESFVSKGLVSLRKCSTIVSSGVDTKRFTAQRQSLPAEPLKVLFIGRLLWQKGFREYIDAARKHLEMDDPVRFDVYGELSEEHPNGVPRNYLEKQVRSGVIQFHGFVDRVEEVYRQYHLLVFPSYYGEGVPRVVLEAAASGIPSIVCHAGWVEGVVKNGETGIVIEPQSSESLIEAIRRFLQDRSLLEQMGKAARQLMEQDFRQDKIIEKYWGVYQSLG